MTITDILDDAIGVLKQRDRDYADFYQWIGYVFETIESEIGVEALETAKSVLDDRFEIGSW